MQSIKVPILWKQSEGINVDVNIEVVPVVSKQPLKCMMYYTPPDTKVTMCVGHSFFLTIMMSSSLGSQGKELAKEAMAD